MTFYIIGNGPSVTTEQIQKLPNGQWLGMNSAYKYWNATNKYPRYYCCLDPVVLKAHARAILELITSSPIEKFFLHEIITSIYPDLLKNKKIITLEAFVTRENLKIPFSTLSIQKQTTGALATRFAIEEGHSELMLIGIDCNYVEVISEAKSTGGLELTIEKEVRRNPNYFIDDYQAPGDKYQIPNPTRHSGNLHLQSFVVLRTDLEHTTHAINITIGGEKSLLVKNGIFPYKDYWSNIGFRKLQCIAMPITIREIDSALDNIELWLNSKYYPTLNPKIRGTTLHIFIDQKHDKEAEHKINSRIAKLKGLYEIFDKIKLTFCSLPDEVNFYKKTKDNIKTVNKSGPNIFFLTVMAHCRKYAFTFQMESDCIPWKAGWLDALENECTTSGQYSWVIGPNYLGPTRLNLAYCSHINGNALYKTGDSAFVEFLDETFTPLLKNLISRGLYDLAYDTLFATVMLNLDSIEHQQKLTILSFFTKIKYTNIILNLGGRIETQSYGANELTKFIASSPDSFLIHGRWCLNELKNNEIHIPRLYQKPIPNSLTDLPLSHIWAAKDVNSTVEINGYGKSNISCKPTQTNFSIYIHYRWINDINIQEFSINFSALITAKNLNLIKGSLLLQKIGKNQKIQSKSFVNDSRIEIKGEHLCEKDSNFEFLIIALEFSKNIDAHESKIEITSSSASTEYITNEHSAQDLEIESLDIKANERIIDWSSFVSDFTNGQVHP